MLVYLHSTNSFLYVFVLIIFFILLNYLKCHLLTISIPSLLLLRSISSSYNLNPAILSSSSCISLVTMIAFKIAISRSLASSDACNSTREVEPVVKSAEEVPLLDLRNTGHGLEE